MHGHGLPGPPEPAPTFATPASVTFNGPRQLPTANGNNAASGNDKDETQTKNQEALQAGPRQEGRPLRQASKAQHREQTMSAKPLIALLALLALGLLPAPAALAEEALPDGRVYEKSHRQTTKKPTSTYHTRYLNLPARASKRISHSKSPRRDSSHIRSRRDDRRPGRNR